MSQPAPSAGARKGLSDGPRVHLPLTENAWSRHQHLFEENARKTKNGKGQGLRILKMRVRESFTHGEGISTPRTYHKGRQPLIECTKHDFKIIYFPFYAFHVFSLFMLFLCFSPFYVFYFFGVDKGIALAPTYPRVQ